jgi:hypothetical protein
MCEKDETSYRPFGQAKESNALSIVRKKTHQGPAYENIFFSKAPEKLILDE